jgi:enoyl-CoA hydratase
VTLSRPKASNAISPEVAVRLADTWREIHDDGGLRAAIVTGAGDRAFCAGADLARLIPLLARQRQPEDDWDRAILAEPGIAKRAMLVSYDVGKPVIAAVNGAATGGGLELLLGTDLRVAVPEARLALPEVKRALFPGGGGPVRLPRQIPAARALEMLLTGDPIEAPEALALGLLNRVVPRARLLDAAFELAERIAANGPLAVQAVRRAVRECATGPELEAIARANEIARDVHRSEDAVEGPRAFLEKRAPVYRGR